MAGGGGGSEELNLVPYLDIMVNLIMFLITITAYIVEMKQTTVLAPGGGPCVGEGCDTQKPKPYLTISVIDQGFLVVSSDGAAVPAWQADKVNGDFPYGQLQAKLREYKENYDLADNLILLADNQIPYKVVVKTIDAAREDTAGGLFPGVTFGVAVKGR